MTKDGIPVILGDLIPLVRSGSYIVISMILTVLMSTRSLKIKSTPDIISITQPFKGDVTNLMIFSSDF